VRKLAVLNTFIESGSYREFWTTFESEDLYADLIVDCAGFEEIMRDAIAVQTTMVAREVNREVIQGWLNVPVTEDLPSIVERYGWTIDGDIVKIPTNKENEAKTTVFREIVTFNRELVPRWICITQLLI
jgi:translation initiation factor 3 subunit K